jgi:hypothetical protein
MAYVAVAAMMACVAHRIIKTGTDSTSAASMKQRRQAEEPLHLGRRGREDLIDNDPAFHLIEISFEYSEDCAPSADLPSLWSNAQPLPVEATRRYSRRQTHPMRDAKGSSLRSNFSFPC